MSARCSATAAAANALYHYGVLTELRCRSGKNMSSAMCSLRDFDSAHDANCPALTSLICPVDSHLTSIPSRRSAEALQIHLYTMSMAAGLSELHTDYRSDRDVSSPLRLGSRLPLGSGFVL